MRIPISIVTLLLLVAAEPKAVISGPKDAKDPGSLVILSAKGSTGKKLYFDCYPENQDWKAVKFVGEDDVGIIFTTTKPGVYYFVVTAVEGDVSSRANVKVTIKGGPGPNDIAKILSDAYSIDAAAGVGNNDQKLALASVYKDAAANINQFQTCGQPWEFMRNIATNRVPAGALPNLRKAIAEWHGKSINYGAGDPMTPESRKVIGELLLKTTDILGK